MYHHPWFNKILGVTWSSIGLLFMSCTSGLNTSDSDATGSTAGADADADGDVDADKDSDKEADMNSDGVPDDTGDSDGWEETTDGTVVVKDGGVVITDGDGTSFVCYKTVCDGRTLECGDCTDNDGDGKTDWRDRECLGPCDNSEGAALISDVGGVTGSTCHKDCYFDYGTGMGTGSDDCWWDHSCDPLEPELELCPYDEKLTQNDHFCPEIQSDRCAEICIPFTPNGCDCFGCCTFPELSGLGENGGDAYVWIGAKDESFNGMCTFDDILNTEKCPRCTPVPGCLNECGHCELCIGKNELPRDCFDDGDTDNDNDTDGTPDDTDIPDGMCPEGVVPCGLEGMEECGPGFFCITGCCQPTTPVV